MKGLGAIFSRELANYFATPLAYVFIVIFLIFSGIFTFYVGGFFERGQADLQPFFTFLPWLYMFLVPAISMRLSTVCTMHWTMIPTTRISCRCSVSAIARYATTRMH